MTYTSLSRWAFPPTLLLALSCAFWAWSTRSPVPQTPAHTGSPGPAVTIASPRPDPEPTQPAPPSAPVPAALPAAAPTTFPPPGAVLTATPGPGPASQTNQPESQPRIWLSEFDRALDREFNRLEEREKTSRDPVELAMVAKLKEKLLALDALWIKADALANVEEKMKVQMEAQQAMGEIIQLGRADRNQRLTNLARSFGVENSTEVARFIEEVDRAFVETHLDWAKLFNRGAVMAPRSEP